MQICSETGSATCAFVNNVTSGNFIFIGAHSEGALTTPTDTRSTTWTLVDTHTGGANVYIWCGVLGSSGAETITLTGSFSFFGQSSFEFPAFAGMTCTKDASANGATVNGSTTTSSITTAQNGDLLLCYMSNFSSSSQPLPQLNGPFRAIALQNGSDAGSMAYQFAGTNGSYSCTFEGTGTSAGYIIAAFKPSAATAVTAALATGSLANSYSYTPQCVGGVGAYTWTASSLPAGLSISSSTGAITGTPTGGTTTPTVTCTGATSGAASITTVPLTVNSSVGTISLVNSTLAAITASNSLGTVTSGDLIVAAMIDGNILCPPTDSLGTVFKFIGNQYFPTGQIGLVGLYAGLAPSGGSDTINKCGSGATVYAAEFSNAQLILDVVSPKGGTNSGSVTISGATLTTLAPASEIWAVIRGWSAGTTYTAGTGFSATGDVSTGGSAPSQGIHANESSTGSYTPSWAQTGNADGRWITWAIALRPSTSGIVSTNHRRAWVIER